MTLNDLERRNSSFCIFSPNPIALQTDYVTVVNDRLIMSVKYRLPVPVFHFWPQLTHPAARSLCDSWVTCCCFLRVIDKVLDFYTEVLNWCSVFTALHVMQTRYCEEISVCPSVRLSVCPSVCHTRGLWQNGRKICPDLYTIRKNIYPSFLRR